MSKKDLTCWFAETTVVVNVNGKVSPCCVYYADDLPNATEKTAIDYYNSEIFRSIRSNLRNGIRDNGCKRCWDDEDNGNFSVRMGRNLMASKEMPHININGGKFISMEIAFSNVCNMTCRHCSTKASSRWVSDDKLLGRWIPSRTLIENDVDALNVSKIDNLEHLRLYGGEPFYSKSHARLIKELDDNDKLQNLSIEYTTNGSIFPTVDILTSWKKLKRLRIFLSIEDYGDKFDYFRTGGKFEQFKENANKFFELQSDTIEVGFHLTLNVLNAHRADEILNYYITEFPDFKLLQVDRVHEPSYLRMEQWDSKTLEDTAKRIKENIIPCAKGAQMMYAISLASDMIKNSAVSKTANFEELFKVNDILDMSRNTVLENVHPVFGKYR